VALPMDEQRILEEMERMLAADDPRLAARLSAFGQPGVGQVFRARRAKAALSLLMVAVIAAAASVIYLMSAFRPGGTPHSTAPRHQTSQLGSTQPEYRSLPFTSPAQQCGVVKIKIAPLACKALSSARR
jgi:hypothetical protein